MLLGRPSLPPCQGSGLLRGPWRWSRHTRRRRPPNSGVEGRGKVHSNSCQPGLILIQTFKGRLRRLYKRTYPWINMTFEGWIMAYNMAYAFEKTPFYRPWLSWVGVDLRRMSVEDLVSISTHLRLRFAKPDCEASSGSSSRQGETIGKRRRVDIRAASPSIDFASTYPRLTQHPTPNCHIFHQIPRVVVLSVVACSR